MTSVAPWFVSITSGKGGVGKTLTTINLAINASRNGHRVLILDADLGLANVDVVLGLKGRYHMKDVLDGHVDLMDIIIEGPNGIHIIPSGSGLSSLTSLSYVQKQFIIDQTKNLRERYDIVFVDTGAGISNNVIHFNLASDHVLVVTTPEPHALTDAYAMIKVLSEHHCDKHISLIINQTRSAEEGLKIFSRIADVSQRFLKVRLEYLGNVPHDLEMSMRVLKRKIGSSDLAMTISGQAWAQMSQKLLGHRSAQSLRNTHQTDFWQKMARPSLAVRDSSIF